MLFYSKVNLRILRIGGIDKLETVPLFHSALIKNIERILLCYILRRQMQ